MSKAPATFRQADLARALRAVDAAGVTGRYRITVDKNGLTLAPVEAATMTQAELDEERIRAAFGN